MRHIGAYRVILAAASILAVLCALPMAPPTLAQANAAPATCRVGLYLRDLHSFDPTADTFGADFWLWSLCPSADHQPLQTMEFVTADDAAVLLEVGGDPLWAHRNVNGTFRYNSTSPTFPSIATPSRLNWRRGWRTFANLSTTRTPPTPGSTRSWSCPAAGG